MFLRVPNLFEDELKTKKAEAGTAGGFVVKLPCAESTQLILGLATTEPIAKAAGFFVFESPKLV